MLETDVHPADHAELVARQGVVVAIANAHAALAGKLRGDRDGPDGAFRAVFEAARLAWRAVASPGTRRPGKRPRECQLSPAA
jgi:hypothetical protein